MPETKESNKPNTDTANGEAPKTNGGVAPAAAPARRQLGSKEPIVFKWKLLGTSGDYILTLFKAVEREDVEAQLERVRKDGYYADLRIVENDYKIVQPKRPEPKATKAAKAKKAPKKAAAKAKKSPAKKAAAKKAKAPARAKSTAKKPMAAAKKARATTKKATKKSAKPAKKKKAGPSKSSARRTTRKK
jgi:hypothetical protein